MRAALGSLTSLGLVALLALPAVPVLSGCDGGEDGPTTCTSTDAFNIEDITPAGTQTGDEVTDGACVSVTYVGRLAATGEEFDSGSGFRFFVGQGQVINGFWLGVREQKVGETRRVTIPPEFGYGTRELPGIPACSTLEFDITVEDTNLAPSLCQR